MKVLRIIILFECAGLLLLSSAFFHLNALPELAPSRQPFISATNVDATPATVVAEQKKTWSMIAVGDIMLDRHVRTTIKTKGLDFPFAAIKSELSGHDIVLGNLEGPFTSNSSVATDTHLVFTFDPAGAPELVSIGLTDVSLANNHTYNFGQSGLDQTRRVLQSADLHYFGDPNNRHGFGFIQEVAGRKIAFIGYNALSKNLDTIIGDVKQAKTLADVVIVMAHWGTEYQLKFSVGQQTEAHQLIDAGADMIIGAHPHVVQPLEIYKDKFIAYSLGNFLFDQYFSTDTLEGLMLKLNFSAQAVSVTLVPVVTERGQIQLLTGARRDSLLSRLASNSTVPEAMRSDIQHGQFTISRL